VQLTPHPPIGNSIPPDSPFIRPSGKGLGSWAELSTILSLTTSGAVSSSRLTRCVCAHPATGSLRIDGQRWKVRHPDAIANRHSSPASRDLPLSCRCERQNIGAKPSAHSGNEWRTKDEYDNLPRWAAATSRCGGPMGKSTAPLSTRPAFTMPPKKPRVHGQDFGGSPRPHL
jgi:hypothetical protein